MPTGPFDKEDIVRVQVIGLLAIGAAAALIAPTAAHSVFAGSSASPIRQTSAHVISVAGHGEIQVTPDEATLNVGVQTTGSDSQSAMSANADKMQAVIAAIESRGVPSKNIQTGNLSLGYDQEKDRYVATHTVTVQVDDVTQVGSVLDAAVAAGANMSWGVSFGLKDTASAQDQALKDAIAHARQHAGAMAAALGVSIAGVQSASTASYNTPPPPIYAGVASSTAGSSTPVQPGQTTVTADVTVVYAIG